MFTVVHGTQTCWLKNLNLVMCTYRFEKCAYLAYIVKKKKDTSSVSQSGCLIRKRWCPYATTLPPP